MKHGAAEPANGFYNDRIIIGQRVRKVGDITPRFHIAVDDFRKADDIQINHDAREFFYGSFEEAAGRFAHHFYDTIRNIASHKKKLFRRYIGIRAQKTVDAIFFH